MANRYITLIVFIVINVNMFLNVMSKKLICYSLFVEKKGKPYDNSIHLLYLLSICEKLE